MNPDCSRISATVFAICVGSISIASAGEVTTSDDLAAWIDARMGESGVKSEAVCDDGTFLRRAYLDLIGRIPSVSETRDFLNDTSPAKRARVIDSLLRVQEDDETCERVSEHFARTWRRVMIPPGSNGAPMGPRFDVWLAKQFERNVGYDEIARTMVVLPPPTAEDADEAQARAIIVPALGGTPQAYADSITRIFLGIRIGCAQCHNHPFDAWTQKDFWGVAAFFTDLPQPRVNPQENPPAPKPAEITFEGTRYFAKVLWEKNERTEIPAGESPRQAFANWMTSPENPNFAATAVNRAWQHLCVRGIVPEVNDLGLASEEKRAELLDPLAGLFSYASYDLRWLIAGICKSRYYQRVSVSRGEGEIAGGRPLKSLTSEQVFDSLEQALMLPITRTNEESPRHNGMMNQLVSRLDESAGGTPEEYIGGVPQALILMNGRMMSDATDLETSRTLRAVVDAPFLDNEQKLDTLFLAAFTRHPNEQERVVIQELLDKQPTADAKRAVYGQIFWALLNSPEFVLCR